MIPARTKKRTRPSIDDTLVSVCTIIKLFGENTITPPYKNGMAWHGMNKYLRSRFMYTTVAAAAAYRSYNICMHQPSALLICIPHPSPRLACRLAVAH